MLSAFTKKPCLATDLTIRHLERKLRRYDRKIQKSSAKPSDYTTRERVQIQLAEARSYLC